MIPLKQVVESNVLRVDADGRARFTSIIDALAVAVDGDIIMVGPGTYSGRIVLPNVDVTLIAAAGAARAGPDVGKSIIEHTFAAAEADQGVIEPSSTGSAVFIGFEISLVHATTNIQACFHAQTNANLHVFKDCRFRQDGTGGSGGGMYGIRVNADVPLQVENCEFAAPTNINGNAQNLIFQGPANTASVRVSGCRFGGDVQQTGVNATLLTLLGTDIDGTFTSVAANVNVDASCRFGTLSGTVTDRIFNGSASTPATVQARRTANLGVPAAFADIDFDTTDIETDAAEIDHDNVTNTDRVTVLQTGLYRVTLQGFMVVAAANAAATFRLRVNDTTVVDGSDFDIAGGTDGNEILEFSRTVYCELTANDFLSWQAFDNGTTGGTFQVPIVFTVEALTSIIGPAGPAGANGAAGADGDVTWDGAWSTATAYTTNQAVTHNGASYVCIAGHTSGASDEPGIGGSWASFWDVLAAKGDTGPAVTSQIVSTGTSSTTTNTTPVLVPLATITPTAGTYAVSAEIQLNQQTNNQEAECHIYAGGTLVTGSTRLVDKADTPHNVGMLARVTVNGSEAIEIRYNVVSNGTAEVNNRQILIWET